MRARFQVLVIPFRNVAAGVEFAVLRRRDDGAWQFVAGGGGDDETPLQAAVRETREEIGLDGDLVPLDSRSTVPKDCFAAAASWGPGVYVIPEHCFAVNAGDAALALSAEHTELRWLPSDEARGLLRWDSNRNALWELHERLKGAGRSARPGTSGRRAGRGD
jgi:dATP pyrophosphohydrolase